MIYLNNAATSYPKFPAVADAVSDAIRNGYTYCNRDSVEYIEVAREIHGLREKLSEIFGAKRPHTICFTPSDSIALNHLINSLRGGLVITSKMEHNSVARPLVNLWKNGELEIAQFDTIDEAEVLCRFPNRKITGAIFSHASNVTGDVVDAEALGALFQRYDVPFVLDVAQSAGFVPIDVEKWHVSALAFAGHKGFGGPQGTGGMYVRDGFSVKPVLFGGTGNASMSVSPPTVLPDSVEVGTPATHDLLGLSASLKEIDRIGWKEYGAKAVGLTQYVHDRIADMKHVVVYGEDKKRVPVLSFVVEGVSCKRIGELLGKRDIVCRTGAHCSAWAMQELGLSDGTVRISFGYLNTKDDADAFLFALEDIIKEL